MACPSPITDAGDCGNLCLCVCTCENATKPKCPNWHVYNLAIELTGGTVTDAGGSLAEILLSMSEVTNDYFIWTRPRIPNDTDVGNITIKTSKVLCNTEGACTAHDSEGPSDSLCVKYLSVTTDAGKLVYEWDEGLQQLCRTSGPVGCKIKSITSNWTITPDGGEAVCCMVRKMVRRIWDENEIATYQFTVHVDGATDGSLQICDASSGGPHEAVSKCDCLNTWSVTTNPTKNTFGDLVDGFYLSAHFESDDMSSIIPWAACGIPADHHGCCGAFCVFADCDATANMNIAPVELDFAPYTDCKTRDPQLLFSPTCHCCTPLPSDNQLKVPVNYAHLARCCETFDNTDCRGSACDSGIPNPVDWPIKCPEGEATQDPYCPYAYANITCHCPDIPDSQSGCDSDCEADFQFPTCPIEDCEWMTVARSNETLCACHDINPKAAE